jgi:hypothetical protein
LVRTAVPVPVTQPKFLVVVLHQPDRVTLIVVEQELGCELSRFSDLRGIGFRSVIE